MVIVIFMVIYTPIVQVIATSIDISTSLKVSIHSHSHSHIHSHRHSHNHSHSHRSYEKEIVMGMINFTYMAQFNVISINASTAMKVTTVTA